MGKFKFARTELFRKIGLFFALSTEHNWARCRWSPPPPPRIKLALCVRSLSLAYSSVSFQSMDLSVVPEAVHFNELAIAKYISGKQSLQRGQWAEVAAEVTNLNRAVDFSYCASFHSEKTGQVAYLVQVRFTGNQISASPQCCCCDLTGCWTLMVKCRIAQGKKQKEAECQTRPRSLRPIARRAGERDQA